MRQHKQRTWERNAIALADLIRDDSIEFINQGIFKTELLSALKRNKIGHAHRAEGDITYTKLSNQSKRDAELKRRMFNDPQRIAFDDDVKKITRKMSDLEIEIEYNRNLLKIRLAGMEVR